MRNFFRVSLQVILAAFALALLGLVVPITITAAPASAVGTYSNADIADIALTKLGQSGGQCKQFANNMVKQVSGNTQNPAPGYHGGFANAGGVQVASGDAVKGDIIQITPAGSNDSTAESMYNFSQPSKRLHTAIIVTNNGGNSFTVVDSNWGLDEKVTQHTFNPYTWAAGSDIRIWRMGTAFSSSIGATDGTLLQVENTGVGWQFYNITQQANILVKGKPGVIWDSNGPNVFAVDKSGALRQFTLCPTGGWCSYVVLASGALSTTAGLSAQKVGSSIEVFATTTDGTLLQIENNGGGWQVYNISQAAGNVKINGSPALLWGTDGPSVFAVDQAGAVRQFASCPTGGWCTYVLTGNSFAGGVDATMNGLSIELFARGTNDHLYQIELVNGGSWSTYDVTNYSGNVTVKGTPGVLWNSGGPSVYVSDSTGRLRQFTICPNGVGWCTYELTQANALGSGAGVDVVQTSSAIEVFVGTQ